MEKNEYKEFNISKKGLTLLNNIQKLRLNNLNLKEIFEKGMLQSTRNEYEKILTQNKQDILKKYNISQEKKCYNGIEVYEYSPEKIISNKICFHIHGGAFTLLSSNSSFIIPVQLSNLCKIKIISIEFGLAPEIKYSDMINNIEKVINKFLLNKYLSENIYLIGESSGGSLCISTNYNLLNKNILIGGIILLSPWLDLNCTFISSSIDDPILCKNNYLDFASSLVINDEKDKNLLPFNLNYNKKFPKILIQFGSRDKISILFLFYIFLLNFTPKFIPLSLYP